MFQQLQLYRVYKHHQLIVFCQQVDITWRTRTHDNAECFIMEYFIPKEDFSDSKTINYEEEKIWKCALFFISIVDTLRYLYI